MTRSIKVTTLPDLPTNIDPQLRDFLMALVQQNNQREGRIGLPGDRFVTINDLIGAGVIEEGDIT